MKIVVAVDSFKGSMTSLEAGMAIEKGIRHIKADAQVEVIPVADGGEGTVEALSYGSIGSCQRKCRVTGATGSLVEAEYTMYDAVWGRTAVIEMAAAAGIGLVPETMRNPLHTTTYGVGEMMRDAMDAGCKRILLGIGGSGTNDGGIGMLQALGYHFVDEKGKEVPYGAAGLERIADIYFEDVIPKLRECSVQVICDVRNPLTGPHGCSAVFAPQKGADIAMVERMERAMNRYADLVEHIAACDFGPIQANGTRATAGTGAAGGLGYACLMFLHASLQSGIETILEEIQFRNRIQGADYVITGEGKMDAQTMMGKTPAGVAAAAKHQQIPVLAFCGCFGAGIEACQNSGLFDACYALTETTPQNHSGTMQRATAMHNLEQCAEQVFSELLGKQII